MNQLLTCPSCKSLLRVPAGAAGDRYTCPRCLADVPPAGTTASAGIQPLPDPRVPPPLPPQEQTAPAGSDVLPCPRCGQSVQSHWTYCPKCAAVLDEDAPEPFHLERQIKKDVRGTGIGMTLLAVLGALGLAYLFVGLSAEEGPGGFLGALLVLLFLAGVTTAVVFIRTAKDPSHRGFGRIVKGTLALTGGLIAGSCVITAAVWAFLFVVCLLGGGRF